jgi:uncharacterized protein YaaW (UPF0174 family)
MAGQDTGGAHILDLDLRASAVTDFLSFSSMRVATAFTQFFVAFQLLGAGFLGAAVLTVMLSPRGTSAFNGHVWWLITGVVNRNAMWTNYLITCERTLFTSLPR